ncbi:MAG TPA: TrkH family potassium uptake protein [Kiloniellales bacterium]|nr:TrkH family potassium uptake protein [Kiloniellales bacterium]
MPDLRPVFAIAGILLAILAAAMLVPATLDLANGDPGWQAFAAAAAVTLFVGIALLLANRQRGWRTFTLKQGFLVANAAWMLVALFGSLPFLFSGYGFSLTDAFFESMSGITTTGVTIISDLERMPAGLLLWRALLNWLGGIGIIVTALAVLPMLQVGGMQLFRIEAFSGQQGLPRAAALGFGIVLVYLSLTILGSLALLAAGMTGFDAVTHAMSALSTGGFSTRDASIGAYASHAPQYVLIVLMLLGAMPFLQLLRAGQGHPLPLWRDDEARWLVAIVLFAALAIAVWLFEYGFYDSGDALRVGLFVTVSQMTGTGFIIADPTPWGGLPTALLIGLMFIGGAADSTTSGVKLFRVQIFLAEAYAALRRLTQPHGVFIPHFKRRPVPDEVNQQVIGFFALFGGAFVALATGLGLLGLDLTTALSAATSALANAGGGFGDALVARGNYSALPEAAKWWLAFGMLIGRLELMVFLVLLSRRFWRD